MIRLWARPRGTIGSPPKTLIELTPWQTIDRCGARSRLRGSHLRGRTQGLPYPTRRIATRYFKFVDGKDWWQLRIGRIGRLDRSCGGG
jgi:hypothetical protein